MFLFYLFIYLFFDKQLLINFIKCLKKNKKIKLKKKENKNKN